jgi:predicted RecA/RadA family phage recombinase
MAIVKTNFLSAELNQFAISTVRGQLADWGLNAQIMEVRIDDEEAGSIYAGDPVKLVSSPKGVITVKAAAKGDAVYGFMIWDTKRTKATAGQYIRVLRDGGVMQMITDEAITAGTAVYIDETDGGVSATGTGLGDPIGLAVEDSAANADGSLIRIEVVKQPLA